MHECTCKHSIQVRNCGKGKFIVQPNPHTERKITLYARVSACQLGISGGDECMTVELYACVSQLLTDRVMVRVGGGWDTLDHFLLKHDPCRLQNLAGIILYVETGLIINRCKHVRIPTNTDIYRKDAFEGAY